MILAYALACAGLNRARGSRLFDVTESTTVARLVSTGLMSLALAPGHPLTALGELIAPLVTLPAWALPILWHSVICAGLMFWCVFAWDDLWSAAIGHDPNHSREWGLAHLGLRMTLAAPCIIAVAIVCGHPWNALYALFTPLLALPYYISGYLAIQPIAPSEYTTGGMLGILLYLGSA